MIREVQIRNFKSIEELSIQLGRVNIFIGANGCGKTNILEAICLGGAAAADKLDNEYLAPRGLRFALPKSMRSGFSIDKMQEPVRLKFINTEGMIFDPSLTEDGGDFPQWKVSSTEWCKKAITSDEENVSFAIKVPSSSANENQKKQIANRIQEIMNTVVIPLMNSFKSNITKEQTDKKQSHSTDVHETEEATDATEILTSAIQHVLKTHSFIELIRFLIYAPDPVAVRRLEDEERTLPLGINGAGLFRLLQSLSQEQLAEIKTHLHIIDWFEDLEIPESRLPGERHIRIKDQYLAEGLQYFEQRVANEGFLFLLFYISLFVSEHTPKFFAIDNIDNGLNPRLCMYLCETICELASKFNKQVILTTHNPAILDGFDLKNDEHRLFVIYRNIEGRTRARRVTTKDLPNSGPPVRLSEAFLRGYIGGLPKNF